MKRYWLAAAVCGWCAIGLVGAEYWRWEAKQRAPLGALAVTDPDQAAAVYQPTRVSAGNYVDVASVAVTPEQTLTFAVEYRIPETLREGHLYLRAVFFNAAGDVVNELASRPMNLADGWRELKFTFRPPPGSRSVLLRVIDTGTDPVWFRQARLYDATAEEAEKIGRYAGTLEEKIILHSHTIVGSPAAVVVLDYQEAPAGEPYSLKFLWDHDEEGFGLVDIGSPMEVPPGGDRRLERMEFQMKVTRNTGDLKLSPTVVVGDINLCSDNMVFEQLNFSQDYPADGQWRKFEYVMPETKNIAGGSFLLRLHGRGETTFFLSRPKFYYSDGTTATGFSVWQDPLWMFPDWSQQPFQSKFTSSEGMILADSIQATQAGPSGREALLELKRRIPNFANDMIYGIDVGLAARQWYEDHDIAMTYQNIPNGLWQLAISLDPNSLSFRPESYGGVKTDLHKFNAANPVWREVFSRFAERFKDYGMPELMSIDCIFQFGGDAEQYEPFFRDFLNRRDEGYELKGEDGRQFFNDYFKNYAGFEPTPEFFGWSNWDEYEFTPFSRIWNAGAAPELRRRGWLDTLLRHYAFLMYNTRLGEELGKRNVSYFLMNNGDNWQNGNDWEINARSTAIPGFVEETFFYHPACMFHAVTDAMAFRDFYAYYGTHHRLIQEDGQGGHGNPYWDLFNTFALVSTICAGAPYDSMQVDWPFESSMETLRGNGNVYTKPRYNTFISMASAFNTQREIGVGEVPESTRHTVMLHENSANIAGDFTPQRLSRSLSEGPWYGSNASFNLWNLPYVNQAKVLFNDYYALPVGGADQLLTWLDAEPGRALVLNGFTAGKQIDGTYWGVAFGWDQKPLNAPAQFAEVLGSISERDGHYEAGLPPDEVLLTTADGNALLSVYRRDGDRKIYYYSAIPGRDPAVDAEAVRLIMQREFGPAPYEKVRGDSRVFRYDYANGNVLLSCFSNEALTAFRMDDPWVVGKGLFQFEQPEVDNEILVRALKPGNYQLYAFMKGEAVPVTVPASGEITLHLRGQACELYYLLPEDATASLTRLEAMRAEWLGKLELEP